MAATEVLIADGPNLDAFGRLRVSQPIVLFDSQLTYDQQSLLWDAIIAAGGSQTYQANASANLLQVNTTPNASIARQSKAYHRYRPGHSLKITMTFNLKAAVQNVIKRVGFFDLNDGIFLQQAGSGAVTLVRRTSTSGVPVDNAVAQAAWNIDPMDGNGPSGMALDWALAQNMLIDLQALYVGRVRVGFNLGVIRYVHEFNFANVLSLPYIRTANLPVRYEITATGAAPETAELLEICSSVVAEASGIEERGYPFAADTGVAAARTVQTTPFPLIAVRPKATFGGRDNHSQLIMETAEFQASSGTGPFRWRILYNPTVTGGAWASVHADSIAEVNITGTALVGGIPIQAGFSSAANGERIPVAIQQGTIKLPWCLMADGTQIPVVLECTDLTGSSDLSGAMQWRELR